MKKAYLFPGQGSQFVGMGKNLYKKSDQAKKMFCLSNELLGFKITSIMFNGPDKELRKTVNAQLSIYICSVIESKISNTFDPNMVAGHSLGEFSALASIGVLSFEDGLILIKKRASLMQKICNITHGGMIAVIGLEDNIIESICKKDKGIIVPSNYNAPGQLVVSGEFKSIKRICPILKKNGAKRIIYLPVHGAFHSPIMKPAEKEFRIFIKKVHFKNINNFSIYQNINGLPYNNCLLIKNNLVKQLTYPVKWKQSIVNMFINGANTFIEIGEKNFLKKMNQKILKSLKKK